MSVVDLYFVLMIMFGLAKIDHRLSSYQLALSYLVLSFGDCVIHFFCWIAEQKNRCSATYSIGN